MICFPWPLSALKCDDVMTGRKEGGWDQEPVHAAGCVYNYMPVRWVGG